MPIAEAFVVRVGASLAASVITAGGTRLVKKLGMPPKEKALARCAGAGLTAFLDAAVSEKEPAPEYVAHLEDLLEHFARQEEVHEILADLLKGAQVEPDELVAAFGKEYDVDTLPGVDLEIGLGRFAVAFLDCAIGEAELQDVLQTGQLVEQTKLLRKILLQLERREEGSAGAADSEARTRYLRRMRREWQVVPIAALGGEEGAGEEVTLDQVYVELDTNTRVALTPREAKEHDDHPPVRGEPSYTHRLSALEAFERSEYLVLLGDAGAGKSSFVKVLLSRLAAAGLDASVCPPAGLDRNLLPVLVVLRDLSARLSGLALEGLSHERRRKKLAEAVRGQVRTQLDGLEEEWDSGHCLLVLDGLDEVPEALRERVREAVAATCRLAAPERVIVTCRVRSYQGAAVLSGFDVHTLAPLGEDKIRRFCIGWYQAQKELGRVDAEEAERRGESLAEAALSGDLRELAENPMLLTTLALIHQRNKTFPDHRVELYDTAIGVLTEKWQKAKGGDSLTPSPQLAAVLNDSVRLGEVLQRLAMEALRIGGTAREKAAGVPRGHVLTLLDHPAYLGDAGLVTEFLDYVDQRAGLLVGHGGEPGRHQSYSFPHRTFQEYLAGRYLVSRWDPVTECFERAQEGDLWALAVELGSESLLWVDGKPKELLRLAYGLGLGPERDTAQWRRAVLWSAKMAALRNVEEIERDTGGPVEGRDYLEQIRPRLVQVMRSDLPTVERAAAGRALAVLGDPREEVTALDGMEFCWVPAGGFRMGSEEYDDEKPVHDLEIPYGYWMARYPVTVAQFREYVAESGVTPGDEDSLKGVPNEPVVRVSWREAVAFCEWLTERWRQTGRLPAGWGLRLPSEAEWEKAARGGFEVPVETVLRRLYDGGFEATEPERRNNPAPAREHPWQGDFSPGLANSEEIELDTTSAVGCFAGGTSPYGCEEMAGNVWEWTRSLWGESFEKPTFGYPYDPSDGREDLSAEGLRVLRGGSFFYALRYVRCAARGWNLPDLRFRFIGFRVVSSPSSSGL